MKSRRNNVGSSSASTALEKLFAFAVTQHRAGALDEAQRRYRDILANFPDHADSLHNLGLLAFHAGNPSSAAKLIGKALKLDDGNAEYHYNMSLALRALGHADQVAAHLERAVELRPDHALAYLNLGNVHHEKGRLKDAVACYERAAALAPNLTGANINLGNVLLQLNRWEAAMVAYRRVLAVMPTHAETHHRLGMALMAQRMHRDATTHFAAALELKPDLPGAYEDLARAYIAQEKSDLALQAAARALELNDSLRARELFVQCAKSVRFTADNPKLRALLLRALSESWCRPRELTNVCISLIKLQPDVSECLGRSVSAWPARLNTAESFFASGIAALAGDLLAICLLQCSPLAEIGLERLLTNIRYGMLRMSDENDAVEEQILKLFAAIAQQCFINEYVYQMPRDEEERARALRDRLAQALKEGKPVSPLWPITIAAYFPLHAEHGAASLLERSWPDCVRAVFVQQIQEPAEERRLAATMPALTIIDDEVSRVVRAQYEDNPYPRWVKSGQPTDAVALNAGPLPPTSEVLIAGCGTGLYTIELARHRRDARILAVDLSLASLSYAKRMAERVGLSNIEFAQADILHLDRIGRDFDFIDSAGVLHHLADPLMGLKVLLSLLRPGGLMRLGLYSELARQNVVAARALIDERRVPPTPEGIRLCREIIMNAEDTLLKSLLHWGDFFTLSECRDLLFHVQEHRFTLPQIKSILAANNLQFAGFLLDPSILSRFIARFSDSSALLDLDCWHELETESPSLFATMYQFWVRKPPDPAREGTNGTT